MAANGPYSYRDAVRALGDSPTVRALDTLLGGVLLGASTVFPPLLALFDAKSELIRLSHELVAEASARRHGKRHDRTVRLEAAHTIIVITAFFEAVSELDLPIKWRDVELTRREQDVLTELLRHRLRPLSAAASGPSHRVEIDAVYGELTEFVLHLLRGLAVWDRLTNRERAVLDQRLHAVSTPALRRYDELLRRLMVDAPEVAFWVDRADHEATRSEVRAVRSALLGLERTLTGIAVGREPDERRDVLARSYRAVLERPILDADDAPDGMVIPRFNVAYVDPRFRVRTVWPGVTPSNESWWEDAPVRLDLHEFLVGHLTLSTAYRVPTLVLGQPGAGKSKLTEVLAARLPATDFLTVRVTLRDVPADTDLVHQIEHAVRRSIREDLSWAQLVRSAGDALPVVLLDGFDELLQATGVSQNDYLIKVRDFQRREAELGQPVAVIVTSRIAVADRARIPDGTVVLRLEPFDEAQVTQWLDAWNTANAPSFAARGLTPLPVETAMAYPELAEQPLLLTMLALYDADANALQRSGRTLLRGQLYEQLLSRFARRQVLKVHPELAGADLTRAVERELLRLSITAFAMFNRGTQWVAADDLDRDLAILLPEPSTPPTSLRAPLSRAATTVGSFFFVHRARAQQDEQRTETYEFLHATFGEFLIARLAWHLLEQLVAQHEAAANSLLGTGSVDDSVLHAVLSFYPLTSRTPIVQFLLERASDAGDNTTISDVACRLFRVAHDRRPERLHADYEPRRLSVTTRHAVYSANLVLLAVVAAGNLRVSELFDDLEGAIFRWRNEAMLWRSQLNADDGWPWFINTFAVRRIGVADERDVILSVDDGRYVLPVIDLMWSYGYQRETDEIAYDLSFHNATELRSRANFTCDGADDLAAYTVDAIANTHFEAVHWLVPLESGQHTTLAAFVIDHILTLPLLPQQEVEQAHSRAVQHVLRWNFPDVSDDGLLLACLDQLVKDPRAGWSTTVMLILEARDGLNEGQDLQLIAMAVRKITSLSSDVHEDLGRLLKNRTWNPYDDRSFLAQLDIWETLAEVTKSDQIAAELVWDSPPVNAAERLAEHRPSLSGRYKAIQW